MNASSLSVRPEKMATLPKMFAGFRLASGTPAILAEPRGSGRPFPRPHPRSPFSSVLQKSSEGPWVLRYFFCYARSRTRDVGAGGCHERDNDDENGSGCSAGEPWSGAGLRKAGNRLLLWRRQIPAGSLPRLETRLR